MAHIAERPCTNCGGRNCLQVDSARGEVACEICAMVIASGLEEDEGTRFAKDATFADVDDDVRGGVDGHVIASKPVEVSKVANARIVSFLRLLREKTKASEAILTDAIELTTQLGIKKRERNERIEKPFATAAACFHVASCRCHSPLPFFELVAADKTLKILDCRQKLSEVQRTLNLQSEYRKMRTEWLAKDLLRLYLQRLRWNIELFQAPLVVLVAAIDTLKLDQISDEEQVIAALILLRTSAAIRHQCVISNSNAEDDPHEYRGDRSALLNEVSAACVLDSSRLAAIVSVVASQEKHLISCIVTTKSEAKTTEQSNKRPRDE